MITGVGSLPGTEYAYATQFLLETAPEYPWLPELPERGWRYSMISRAVGWNAYLPAEVSRAAWRLTSHESAEQRRARSAFRTDLDDFEETAANFSGRVRVPIAGPVTLAAAVQLPNGEAAVSDLGASWEIASSWQHAITDLIAELSRRMPAIDWLVQVDEPLLAMVSAGELPTSSKFAKHPAWPKEFITRVLAAAATVATWFHTCAPVAALPTYFDTAIVDPGIFDSAGKENWLAWLGGRQSICLPVLSAATPDVVPRPDELADRAERWIAAAGVEGAKHVLSPTCGLAGWSEAGAKQAFAALRDAAEILAAR